MNRRTHESPMDFEWQNPGGPADTTSPFYKLSQSVRRSKLRVCIFRWHQTDKYDTAGFDSPSKPLTQVNAPSFFSATPAKTAPQFRNPSFTTPRKPFDADLFSETSGAESSPADNADAEDTPENIGKKTHIVAAKVKQPIFGKYGLGWGHSPGRSDVKRTNRHTETALQKARKRKRIDRDHYTVARRGSSESEAESSRPTSRDNEKVQREEGWLGSFFTNLERRKDLPYVLSHYPQILLNFFLFGCIVWLIVNFLLVAAGDLRHAQQEEQAVVIAEIAKCNQDYLENRCAPETRLPALQSVCHAWEICMDRNPASVSKSRLTAQAMGQALNSFIEPISWKAMVSL